MRHARLGLVLLTLALVSTTACYKHTFRTGATPATREPALEKWQNNFLWGLINSSGDVQVDQICPKGAAVLHNRVNFWNGLVNAITFGIYNPTTVQVWCAADGSLRTLQLDVTPELLQKAYELDPGFEERVAQVIAAGEQPRVAGIPAQTTTF